MTAADWPTHPHKEWQNVLDKARSYGWTKPAWTSSHPKLILQCPEKNPACTQTIFKTGNGTEQVAKMTFRKLDRCVHRVMTAPLAKVDFALDTAERLISGAEAIFLRDGASDHVNELLDLAAQASADAEAELERELYEADGQRERLADEVVEHLGADGVAATVGDVSDEAGSHLRTASVTLSDLPKRADRVVTRFERLGALSDRRDRLQRNRA